MDISSIVGPVGFLETPHHRFFLPTSSGNGTAAQQDGPVTRTKQPIVTGTSVLAVMYKDGVMMAADCLASYGGLARFRGVQRLTEVGGTTLLGSSGDFSDFQNTKRILDALLVSEYCHDDGQQLTSSHIYEYLARVMYERRTKMNPLWNMHIVGGYENGEKFLGYVDLKGTTYKADTMATGYGAHIALPLLRDAMEGGAKDTMTEEEARALLEKCMKVLFYRDARSINQFQIAKVDKNGPSITAPYSVETEWAFAETIRGYAS